MNKENIKRLLRNKTCKNCNNSIKNYNDLLCVKKFSIISKSYSCEYWEEKNIFGIFING
jgi:hypothetical protein